MSLVPRKTTDWESNGCWPGGTNTVSRRRRILAEGAHPVPRPCSVVYDLAPPYERNWRLIRELLSDRQWRRAGLVFTAVNAAKAIEACDPDHPVFEVVGYRADLKAIVRAGGGRAPPIRLKPQVRVTRKSFSRCSTRGARAIARKDDPKAKAFFEREMKKWE